MPGSTMRATATIRSPPSINDYVSLEQYQAQTPESFAVGRAILHAHLEGAVVSIPGAQRGSLALFPADMARVGQDGGSEGSSLERKVDLFVSSDNFTMFSPAAEVGVSILYPAISIHAVKQVDGQRVIWMQLELDDGGTNDDTFTTVDLTIVPAGNGLTTEELYEAISACSELHPDPDNDDSEAEEDDGIALDAAAELEPLDGFLGVLRGTADGSLPPPVPGSGGWITSENAHEFFDEDGNWIADDDDGELGEGAGRIRSHAELEPTLNGNGQDGMHDNKRTKVDED
ncbi:benzoylformate decarboxylase [Ophiocordyceps camponoti-floridani]|uniref:Benzoylformate decarboxylase n=1 Tax=Ophiocordyceps camponoti-floridani TaxID=2030778 RepID=A0A8H4Q5I2_9HYPO|nr:benzoylformate decarboxylase [Ophiocordyceps camponoti-floridani]